MLIKRGLLLAAAALLTMSPGRDLVPGGRPSRGGARPMPSRPEIAYAPREKEFYMAQEQLDYIRPGLNITVNGISNVGPLKNPIVDISITDDQGQPVDRQGVITPGLVIVYFMLARYDPSTRDYFNYTSAAGTPLHDIGGDWNDLAVGHSVYTFRTSMPLNFDVTQTATLGIYSTRYLTDIIGKNYSAPAVAQYFRPDGGTPSTARFDALDITACNTCHNPLSKHEDFGPAIQDVKLCVMCHTPDFPPTATGESLNFKVYIHKIHRGENLPSVQAGTPYVLGSSDFSSVVMPQDIRNCQTCHSTAAAGYTSWYTFPSRAACASCHDDINWVTGANHPAGPQASDAQCANCHAPQGSREWDASIIGAHTDPTKSSQLAGLQAAIVSVSNTAPGQKPTVVFKLTQNDGSFVTPASLGSNLNLLMGGPTADYGTGQAPPAQPFRESASGAAYSSVTGRATYTFTNAVPASATGTWAFSIEARRSVTLSPAPNAGPTSLNEGADNPVAYAAVTDATATPRRAVVDIALCNTCHDRLALHGTQRFQTEECVICHNPNASDVARRPADQLPVESIDFKRMIHRIHSGENLTQDFTIYGFGTPPSVNNFNHVRFPGDRRDCASCHKRDTFIIPDDPSYGVLLPTNTPRDYFSPMQWTTTACLGCHDTRSDAAHAFVMTSPFGESCAACHGPNSEFSVAKVHAR